MPKVRIKFPQLCVEIKEIEVTEAELQEALNNGEEFGWKNLTESEQSWVPNGEKGFRDAFEYSYAEVKQCP